MVYFPLTNQLTAMRKYNAGRPIQEIFITRPFYETDYAREN